jgi:thiol:disulfide interchange protein
MERFFQILALVLAGVAAWFLWVGDTDGLFLAAVGGSVCFFLSIRVQVKARQQRREAEVPED